MDPISDMLIRIKNAQRAGRKTAQIPYSKFKQEIAKAILRVGFVESAERKGKRVKKIIEVGLKEGARNERPLNVRLISKPGRRLYVSGRSLRPSLYGGVYILSTSKGVMSDKEARKAKVGGELIAEIW